MTAPRSKLRLLIPILVLALVPGCGEDEETPTAPRLDPAEIVVSLERVDVTAQQGEPDPAPLEIQITNGGEVQLSGLEVAVDFDGDPEVEWLTATLDGATAPARLSLQANQTGLEVGRYEARVVVTSAVVDTPTSVPVTFQVDARPLADLTFGKDPTLESTSVEPRAPLILPDFEIVNEGEESALFELAAYISTDATGSDAEMVQVWLYDLAPGETRSLELSTYVGRFRPPGQYYLGLVLDPLNDIEESDETNNARTIEFTQLAYTVEVETEGAGSARVDPDLEWYEFGAPVTLSAEPATGWSFAYWRVAIEAGPTVTHIDNPLPTSVDRSIHATAVFVQAPVLTGQVSETGRTDLTWSFDWPCVRVGRTCETSSEDRYEIAMANLLAGTPFETIHTTENTRESPFRYALRVDPGQWAFRVRAHGSDWTSGWSEPLVIDFEEPSPPAAPSGLTATATAVEGGVRFDLTWADNADNEDSYRLQAAWDSPVFGGGAPLPANSTSYSFVADQTPGERLYFRIEAINALGASASNVAFADIPVRNGAARFFNQTDYPVYSLMVGGVELLPGAMDAYLRGQWYRLDLAPGNYDFRMTNGIWDGSGWNRLYRWEGTVTVEAGGLVDVSFPNPSVTDLMTRFSPQHTWTGDYIGPGGIIRYVAVTFRADRQYTVFVDGAALRSGTYRLVQRAPVGFLVEIQLDGQGLGTLYEHVNRLDLQMEPGYLADLFPQG